MIKKSTDEEVKIRDDYYTKVLEYLVVDRDVYEFSAQKYMEEQNTMIEETKNDCTYYI